MPPSQTKLQARRATLRRAPRTTQGSRRIGAAYRRRLSAGPRRKGASRPHRRSRSAIGAFAGDSHASALMQTRRCFRRRRRRRRCSTRARPLRAESRPTRALSASLESSPAGRPRRLDGPAHPPPVRGGWRRLDRLTAARAGRARDRINRLRRLRRWARGVETRRGRGLEQFQEINPFMI